MNGLIINERRFIMLKKLLIETNDLKTIIYDWSDERANNLENMLKKFETNKDQYLIGLDIASKDSKDYSVLTKVKIVDGKYFYEGYEIV